MIEYAGSVMDVRAASPIHFEYDDRWAAVQQRNASRDGSFFYGVVSTRVFCKPSCASRQPLRTNVRFFESTTEAQAAGFRACKRCHPLAAGTAEDASARYVREACGLLAASSDNLPTLAQLATRAGVSQGHFQRTFKRLTGVTPMQYAGHLRTRSFKAEMKKGRNVTDSAHSSGFNSSRAIYEGTNAELGMSPAQYRKGGKGIGISYVAVPTPLGRMMLAATDRGLCFLQFGDTEAGLLAMLTKEYPFAELQPVQGVNPALKLWLEPLLTYVSGQGPSPDLPVDVRATAFQLRVWRYLQTIPAGETRSYSEVAQAIGMPTAPRAVARACASNQVALLIPCHRVLRGDGSLSGYRWGVERKEALLDLEKGPASKSNSSTSQQKM